MGFSQSDVTKADRKRAEEILDDINMAYVTAQECGGDEGRAAERELAYSIGLIRAEEREKFAGVVEALQSARDWFVANCAMVARESRETFAAIEAALANAAGGE